jgi:DNA-binding NtrC family response regulator
LPMPLRTLRSTLVARIERMAISQAMRLASGNKAAAARLLSVDVKTLYSKLRRYDLARRPNSGSVKQRPIGD